MYEISNRGWDLNLNLSLIDNTQNADEELDYQLVLYFFFFSRDGKTALLGTTDGWVIFCDLQTYATTRYEKVGESVTSALCTSDGSYFVSCSKTIKIWDVITGTCISLLPNLVSFCFNCDLHAINLPP